MVKLTRLIIPSIVGGIVIAVCAFIPLVSYFCCIYAPLGGFVSAAVQRAMAGKDEALESMDGMAAGAGAGAVAAVIYAVAMAIVVLLMGGAFFGLGAITALASKSLTPLLMMGATGLLYGILMVVIAIITLLIYFAIYIAFGAVGGAICAATMYKKENAEG